MAGSILGLPLGAGPAGKTTLSRALPVVAVFISALIISIISLAGMTKAKRQHAYNLPESELAERVKRDMAATLRYRRGLQNILTAMRSDRGIFPSAKMKTLRVLPRADRAVVCNTWKSSLDYVLALDSIGKFHKKFYRIKDKDLRKQAFLIRYSAFLAQYAFAMEFIAIAENDPGFDKILNEPLPRLGLPERSYAKFKFRFLNAERATEFASLTAFYRLYRAKPNPDLLAQIDQDKKLIWKMGRGKGPAMTGKNAMKIVQNAGHAAWFPVQAGVSEWMGDVKAFRRGEYLISQEQIAAMEKKLEPGDIMLTRREWYLSNVGLPGFWPHATLYIGTPEMRRRYFNDAATREWAIAHGQPDGDFEELLRKKFPAKYKAALAPLEDGHVPRIIEAVGEGEP